MRGFALSGNLRALVAGLALAGTGIPATTTAGDDGRDVQVIILDGGHGDHHVDRHHGGRHLDRHHRVHGPKHRGARERINRHFRHRLETGTDRGRAWRHQRIHRPRHNSRAHVPTD